MFSVQRNDYRKHRKPDDAATPVHVCEFIASLFPHVDSILDPCAGSGNMCRPFRERGCDVTEFEIRDGRDFFCAEPVSVDLVVANPPWNGLRDGEMMPLAFLRKIIHVVGNSTPIVVIVPAWFVINQKRRSKRWKWLRDNVVVSSVVPVFLDDFPGVQAPAFILVLNAGKHRLKPFYWLESPRQRAARGGSAKTTAKIAAAKENGRKAQSAEARDKMRRAWENRRRNPPDQA